jgi:hypothetical protein
VSFEIGTIHNVKPLSKSNRGLVVELPNKQKLEISFAHLSDHMSNAEPLAKSLSLEKTSVEAVVLRSGSELNLSLKPSLVDFAKTETKPKIVIGSIFPGIYLTNVVL